MLDIITHPMMLIIISLFIGAIITAFVVPNSKVSDNEHDIKADS